MNGNGNGNVACYALRVRATRTRYALPRAPYELVCQKEKRKEALLAIRCMALSRTMWFNPTPKLANRAILDFKGYNALTLKE